MVGVAVGVGVAVAVAVGVSVWVGMTTRARIVAVGVGVGVEPEPPPYTSSATRMATRNAPTSGAARRSRCLRRAPSSMRKSASTGSSGSLA